MNHFIIQGRLVRDPETKQIKDSTLAEFTVALDDGTKENKKTYFFNCKAWGKTAENISKFFEKGKGIIIEGKIVQDSWTTPEGKTNSKTYLMVEKFHFPIGSKSDSQPTTPEPESIPESDTVF